MQSEQQYIDFFQQYRETIERSCSPLLNAPREKAFECFKQNGFPVYGTEDYQHTNIPALLEADYGININKLEVPANTKDVFCCDVPNLSTCLHFVVNDQFYKKEQSQSGLPAGVFSGSLIDFAKQYPDVFSKYYGKQADVETDGLSAFNTMFAQDGYALYVPKNVIVEKPIQLINMLSAQKDTLVNRRMLIIIEEGAQAKLLICYHTSEENTTENTKLVATQVSEIFVAENAFFDCYELEESTPNTVRLTSSYMKQEASSNATIDSITLINGFTRNNYSISLDGEFAETRLYGMAIIDGTKQVDNHTNIEHRAPNCHSDELFKYVLDNKAVGAFSGRIVVDQDAQKTRAYQNNKNLCMSRESRMFSKPQLEIYADDVKCSHGLTTGQLDETALFYMRSRGINEEEARMLLKFAFTYDVIDGIRLEGLKDRLKMLVEKRFRGELMKCKSCNNN